MTMRFQTFRVPVNATFGLELQGSSWKAQLWALAFWVGRPISQSATRDRTSVGAARDESRGELLHHMIELTISRFFGLHLRSLFAVSAESCSVSLCQLDPVQFDHGPLSVERQLYCKP